MVLLEGHHVVAPLYIVSGHHAVALNFQRVVRNYFISRSQDSRHVHLFLLGAERVVANAGVVLDDLIEMSHILNSELGDVLVAHAYDFKSSLHHINRCSVALLVIN